MSRIYLLFFFAFLAYCRLAAQSCGMVAYDSGDGLPANNYICVFQDSRGILWVGSYGNGVSHFDGKHWENWMAPRKMMNNTVQNVFEDGEGGIWFDHNDHGASRWKDGKMQGFDFDLEKDTCPVGRLQFDRRQKKVFIIESPPNGKQSPRVYVYNYSAKRFVDTGIQVIPENIADDYEGFGIFIGEQENEWWVTAKNNTKQTRDFYHLQNGVAQKLPTPPITSDESNLSICPSPTFSPGVGDAIFQNEKGIFILRNNHWQPLPVPAIPRYTPGRKTPPLIYKYSSFDAGSNSLFAVWYLDEHATEKRCLLAEYDATSLDLRRTMLYSNPSLDNSSSQRQIIKDAAGTIWLATPGKLLRIFPDQFFIPVSIPGMPSQLCGVAQASDGNTWFSSEGDGLVGFDGLYLVPQPPKLKPNKRYTDGSLTDKAGNMYFNSSDNQTGILRFDGKNKWDILAGGQDVIGFFLNRDIKGQILWGTSGKGLWILPEGKAGRDTADWKKINQSKGLLLDNVLTALEDQYGRYWMGRLSQGIAVYEPKTDKVLNWMKSQNPNNYGCISMAKDAHENLWFGTDRGLCYFENRPNIGQDFDLQKNLQRITEDFIDSSTVMSCFVYNEHTLAFGNTSGLHLLDLDAFYGNPRQVLIRSFNAKNGYQAGPVGQNDFFVDGDSCIWLTGAKGALRYNPQVLPRDTASPQVYLDSLTAGGKVLKITSSSASLSLGSGQLLVQIYFHAPPNPMLFDNIRFQYRLTGDSNWVNILPGVESLTFQSLKHGTYVFEIRAVKEGTFSPAAKVEFRILPVLWERPLFWLTVVGGIIAISLILRRKEQKIHNQQLQLETSKTDMEKLSKESDKLKVQAIVNQLNPHFINNALQWLQVRLEDDEEAVGVVGKLSENISTVFKNSRQKKSYHSLRQEIKLAENYLFIQKRRFRDKLEYEMPTEEILSRVEMVDVPLMIVQIHVENAVEHGIRNKNEGGKVQVSLRDDAEYVVLMVEDNGVGRAAAKIIGSKGTQNGTLMLRELETIYNSQNRLPIEQVYEDNLFVDKDGKAHGTRVIIRVPKKYNYEI